MKFKNSSLLKSLSIYTLASFFNASIPFLLLPILTGYIEPKDLGKLYVAQVILRFLEPIVLFGSQHLTSIDFFQRDKDSFKTLLSSSAVIPSISVVLFSVLAFFTASFWADLFDLPKILILLFPLFAYFAYVPAIFLQLVRNLNKPFLFSLYQIGWTVLNVGLSLLFVVSFDMNWEGRIGGIVLSNGIVFLLGIVLLYQQGYLSFDLNWKDTKKALLFGMPLILHNIGTLIINKADIFFVDALCGKETLGIYMVGYQIGMIIMILQAAFEKAWTPFLFSKLKNPSYADKIKLVKIIYASWLFFIGSALLVGFVFPYVFEFYIQNPLYVGAKKYIIWIALGYAFLGIYKSFCGFIFYEKKAHLLAGLTILNGILNMGLNYILIMKYDAIGAAYATLISMIFISVLTFFLSYKVYKMPWLLRPTNS